MRSIRESVKLSRLIRFSRKGLRINGKITDFYIEQRYSGIPLQKEPLEEQTKTKKGT